MTKETKTDFFDEALEDMTATVTEDEGEIGAEEWEPESAGQALRGIFMKAAPKATKYGTGYTAVIKDVDTNEYVKVWCKRTMLKRQISEDSQPAPGSPVVFKYNGLKPGQNGNDYHSYQVRAEKSDPQYWLDIMNQGHKLQVEFDQRGQTNVVGPTAGDDEADPF